MTEEEFDMNYSKALNAALEAMADSPEVDHKKFYHLTYVLENLRFFSPVLFGLLKDAKE